MHHPLLDTWHDPHATAEYQVLNSDTGEVACATIERKTGPSMLPATYHRKTDMAEDIEEDEGPDELIEDDLDEIGDDEDLIADDPLGDDDDDVVAVIDVEDDIEGEDVPAGTAKAVAKAAGEETDDDDDDEPDDEDVEASLDTILKERLVVEEVVEDDEETPEPEDRSGDGVERVLPKQPGEFVCRSCFLVKHGNQLADKKKMLCRDCV